MRLLQSAVMASVLFPAAALAQQSAPAATPAPAAPAAAPAAPEKKDSTNFTWSMTSSLKYTLWTTTDSAAPYVAVPVTTDDPLLANPAASHVNGFYGKCFDLGDCATQGNNISLGGKVVQGPMSLSITVPLLDGDAQYTAIANRDPGQTKNVSIVDGIVRRTRLIADYADDVLYARLRGRLQNVEVQEAFAGVKVPVGPGKVDFRFGRWEETALRIGDASTPSAAKVNQDTGAITIPKVSTGWDSWLPVGARLAYAMKFDDIEVTPYGAMINGIDYGNRAVYVNFDKRGFMGGVRAKVGLAKDMFVTPEFHFLTSQHVWMDGGTAPKMTMVPATAPDTGTVYKMTEGVESKPVAFSTVNIMSAKVGYEMPGVSTSAIYWTESIGKTYKVKSYNGGKVVKGDELEDVGSQVQRIQGSVEADSSLLGLSDLGTKGGKAVVGFILANWKFSADTEAAEKALQDKNETDTVYSIGWGNDAMTLKLNYERWVTKGKTYILNKDGHKARNLEYVYLSSDIAL